MFFLPGFSNDEKKMMNVVNMVNSNITNNLDVSSTEGPVASRTRSKTKLLQQKDLDETIPKQTVLQDRQSGSPQKPWETFRAQQAVIQSPRSLQSHTRKLRVQGKDAATQVSKQGDEKVTKNADCQVTFDNDPDTKSPQPSLTERATDVPKAEFLRGKQYPVTKTKSEQQTIPSSDMNADGKIKNLRAVNTIPQVTQPHNAQGRETCREKPMKTLRNAYPHLENGTRDQTKSKIHNSKQIANLMERSCRELLRPCECGKRFISDASLMIHQENCPEFRKFTGQTDEGGKPCIKDGRVIPGLNVASNQDTADSHQAHVARVKTKCKMQSTEQIGNLTESSCRAGLKLCVCGKKFISDDYLSKHQGKDCPAFATGLSRCSYREDLKHCECRKRFMSDADLMIHREDCPEFRKCTGQRFEDESSFDGRKPSTEAGRVVPGLNVASNQDTADSKRCGNSLQHQDRDECSSLQGAHGLTRPDTCSSANKCTKSPPNSEYHSLQEGTNQRVNHERPDHLTPSDETVRKTVLKNTKKPNQTSNTDVKQTYKNTRDLNPNQKEESPGGFGFQSNKTRQLNNEN